ncbi:MAG: hypothetical protein VB876_01955 [Pirellulales bacterium]
MNYTSNVETKFVANRYWPDWWRLSVIGLAVLILCSCRAVPETESKQLNNFDPNIVRGQDAQPSAPITPGMLPPSAWTGAPNHPTSVAPPARQWSPPGIARPWPREEYLFDGGDGRVKAWVKSNWQIEGLGVEDTIAHYDTLDGRRVVEPSNRVHIYAPKFSAVRKVVSVDAYEMKEGLVLHSEPTKVVVEEDTLAANTTLQNVQTERQIATRSARAQQRNTPGIAIDNANRVMESLVSSWPKEDFNTLKNNVFEQNDKPWLAADVQAANTWTHDKGVQVVIDNTEAYVLKFGSRAQATYSVEREGAPKLRITKSASAKAAQPGDIVEFTLRFENVGTQVIGNVTIVDNLTTRLEYLPDSQTCSLQADFLHQANDHDSLVLRWEVIDPLPVGESGIIKFKCRVR